MTKEEIDAVLTDHARWLRGEGGKRADLSCAHLARAHLARADLSGADLSGADLSGAHLARADLSGADLSGADLSGAYLSCADLSGADLSGAHLARADLSGADLARADLSGADLSGAKINNDKTAIGILRRATRSDGYEFFLWHCEEGFFVKAGCRFFDMNAARQHWTATRAATPLGDETQDILDMLDMFEKAIKRQVQS